MLATMLQGQGVGPGFSGTNDLLFYFFLMNVFVVVLNLVKL